MPDGLESPPALADPALLTAEEQRLQEARAGVPWRAWGPYLSERQWGTVREDYSDSEDAWSYFSHDQARSRAYRWGEDGIAGISDDKQRLCLALALWNERDPIVKERLFGLTNAEGNHGEDVKEYYFYVDNLPTHSYQRYLYKYPQAEFPYNELVAENRARSRHEFEYELVDTGVFDDSRYFDVEVEHAKAGPEDILCRITVHNRSAQDAGLYVLPTLWFRNTWSWGNRDPRPRLARVPGAGPADPVVRAEHHQLGVFYLYAQPEATLLFCENETNAARVPCGEPTTRFPKDGIGDHLLPAYEWNFGDVNPPVHAFATLFLANLEADLGKVDLPFLQESFAKLLLNFTWWVNRKDPSGRNVFEGGFLGLDNIGVFDRSAELPGGGRLEQADGTAWMAMFSQNMLELALMLLDHDETYQGFVLKFVEHFFWIAAAVDPLGENPDEMWDEEDGFFYDVLRLPDGTGARMKVRSLVGLLPLCATTVIEADVIDRYPRITEHVATFLRRNQDLLANIADPFVPGVKGRRLLSLVNEDKLRRILARMLDEERFLGPHGIRSVSRWHLEHPYTVNVAGGEYSVQYEPAESTTGMFGGNSNWRGPVWFPVNLLLIRALIQHYRYYGDDLRVECPTGSGTMMTLFEVAEELSRRLVGTFLRDGDGQRPVYGGTRLFQDDPHWRDLILFYEYFHGDNGAGLGASHQTGWTGLVARLIQSMGQFDADTVLEDRQWPMARPYRRLAAASMPDVATAREARGVTEPRLPRPGQPRR
jgi:hypothetical protein